MDNIIKPYSAELIGAKLYLSGQMTGVPEYNYPKFNEVSKLIREKYGAIVFNPAENFEGRIDLPRSVYMREDIKQLLFAEAVVMIDGWEKSKGACLEHTIAQELEIPIFNWDEGVKLLKTAHAPRENKIGEAAPATAPQYDPVINIQHEWEEFWLNSEDFNGGEEDTELPHREAERLVLGDRQQSYGHPIDNFTANAHMWSGTLYYKLKPNQVITPEDVALMMLQVKVAREINRKKRDNITDSHGYLMTYQMVLDEKRRRGIQ
jgi:hypothetical protein